jgi:hypothetical protein
LIVRVLVLSTGVLAGCGASEAEPGVDTGLGRPRLWTLFDARRALAEGRRIATTADLPDGIDAQEILAPAMDGTATLRIIPAFSEGAPAAYVMPELWADFYQVWAQPWYVLVTAWDAKSPSQDRVKNADGSNAAPIIDVGPDSLFYSPFWVVTYAVVPAGADPARYVSSRQIFEDRLPLHPGVLWTYSLRPDDVKLGATPPVHPFLQTPVASFLSEAPLAWLEGQAIGYFNEGSSNFTAGDTLVVDETPLYELARRGPDGAAETLGAPRVMGSGPPFAGGAADAPGGKPRFGAYSRLHLAVAPATAAAFDPDASPGAAAALKGAGIDPQAYRGRVAANAVKVASSDVACFEAADFPASCAWLDSQAHIEATLGRANITRTEVSACTPLVFYGGKGIGK